MSCYRKLKSADDLCSECILSLPRILDYCARCGDPMAKSHSGSNTSSCAVCLANSAKFRFRRSRSLFHYSGSARTLVTDFKFNRGLTQGRCLAQLLAVEYSHFYEGDYMPDMILPVPLHPARLRERGYNQAQELASTVARICRRPISPNYLLRVRDTPRQTSLSAQERRLNLDGAFAMSASGREALSEGRSRSFALIDDVVTTHSTSNALCKLLVDHGADWVDVWSVARA